MIVTSAEEFLQAWGDGRRYPPVRPAAMRAAMLVSPRGFRVSEQAAQDNRYLAAGASVDPERAHAQHRAVAERLAELGVPVVLFAGQPGLDDAVYPNNAFATVPGRLILGAMRHPVRQRETAREDVRRLFTQLLRYEVVDLGARRCVAELTGPLVIDRPRGVGFCGMSGRVDEAGCAAMHEAFGLALTFRFALAEGEYHTNVVFSVLAGRAAVLHAGSFADPEVPQAIARAYPERTLLLTDEEKAAFCGNCLAVTPADVMMSARAAAALRPEAHAALQAWGFRVHAVAIDELEKGGGSLRCLIAEVF
ncbi:MAG: amidinotransferase [Planctomycetota bacterium]|nr:MAG: amidinotransferase [Planctomycetota bacterium]